MTELDRTKKALVFAECNLKSMASYSGTFAEQAKNALSGITAILNPPPATEEVEVCAGWVSTYDREGQLISQWHADKDAIFAAAADRISCQEVKVKVTREVPQNVERSVSVEASFVLDSSAPHFSQKVEKSCPLQLAREGWNGSGLDIVGVTLPLSGVFTWQE